MSRNSFALALSCESTVCSLGRGSSTANPSWFQKNVFDHMLLCAHKKCQTRQLSDYHCSCYGMQHQAILTAKILLKTSSSISAFRPNDFRDTSIKDLPMLETFSLHREKKEG